MLCYTRKTRSSTFFSIFTVEKFFKSVLVKLQLASFTVVALFIRFRHGEKINSFE